MPSRISPFFLQVCCLGRVDWEKLLMRKKFNIAVVILALILSIVLINKFYSVKPLDIDLSEWSSKYIDYNNGWRVKDGEVTDNDVNLMFGPYKTLKEGKYVVDIDYKAEQNQEFKLYSYNNNNFIYTKDEKLH